ncbi:MAG: hypothetical protein ACLT0Y_06880 [Christensenellales bacterium]
MPVTPYLGLWALPGKLRQGEALYNIPGMPPTVRSAAGRCFARRNAYALDIDYEQQPPLFSFRPHTRPPHGR